MNVFLNVQYGNDYLFDLHISDDMYDSEYLPLPDDKYRLMGANVINRLLSNRLSSFSYKELIELLENAKSNKFAVLSAHGVTINGLWCYTEDDGIATVARSVNSWITKQSNKGLASLILVCCNPGNHEPLVVDTPVIYAKGSIGILTQYETLIIKPSYQ